MNSSFAKLSCVQVTGGGGFPAWIVVFSEEIQKNMDLIQSAREKLYAEVLNEFDAKGIDGMEPRYNGCGRLLQRRCDWGRQILLEDYVPVRRKRRRQRLTPRWECEELRHKSGGE